MKSIITLIASVVTLSATTAFAQLNSSHNYKRPVSQQKVATDAQIVVNERIAPLKLNNNVASVHNYKRQGSVGFEQEAIVALSAPVIGNTPQNPMLLPNYYKGHAKPVGVENRNAMKSIKTVEPSKDVAKR
ncbi:hypothetical protein [Runella sp. SP2]|uniref:hypothetical protein n=1 Tax=Runella sp. SP2 TaxID=2268026 RepID=UPI000F07B5DE|nr:hypothetical protein [Runella sp. SP2]AYQ31316.1 hypothetical protein DTQ70_03595 [Runella sp. SP2]